MEARINSKNTSYIIDTTMVKRNIPAQKAAAEDRIDTEGPSTSGHEKKSKVVYIGHVPHGFFEKQMKEYFSQFGKVTKVRLSRNKKSGNSRGYAFLEFQSAEVAQIASEAMDGYIFFGQKLKSRLLKEDEVHEELFKGANRVFKQVPWKKIEMERHNKRRTPAEERLRATRAIRKDHQRQKKIQQAGIEYEYEGLKGPAGAAGKEGGQAEKEAKTRAGASPSNAKAAGKAGAVVKRVKSKAAKRT